MVNFSTQIPSTSLADSPSTHSAPMTATSYSNSSNTSSLSEPHSIASLLESASAIAAMEANIEGETDDDTPITTPSKPDHNQTPKSPPHGPRINLTTHKNISDVAVSDVEISSIDRTDPCTMDIRNENEPATTLQLQLSAPNENPHHQVSSPFSEHSQDTVESESKTCHNCSTSTSVFWRRDEEGFYNCNACQLYFRYKGVKRPERLFKNKIKLRGKQAKRVKKSSRALAGSSAAHAASPTPITPASSVMAMSNLVDAVALDAQCGSDHSLILVSRDRHSRNSSASSATSNSYTLVPASSQQRRHSLDTQHAAPSNAIVNATSISISNTPGSHRHHRYPSSHSSFFGESLLHRGGHDRASSSGGDLVYHPYHHQKQKQQRSQLRHQHSQNQLTQYQFHDNSYKPTSAISAASTNPSSTSHRKSSGIAPGQRLPSMSAFLKSIRVAVVDLPASASKGYSRH